MLHATFLFVVVSMLLAGCAQTSVTVSKTGEIVGTTKTFGKASHKVVKGLKKGYEKGMLSTTPENGYNFKWATDRGTR